jgi:hypothetical protein
MRKQNLSFKQIGKQILSINTLIESYFNRLRQFVLNLKKFKFDKNNRVFLGFVAFIFLTFVYFLIPAAYNKNLIQAEIENQIFQKYKISVRFNNKISYRLFPKPNFSSKNLTILNNKNEIANVKNFKIFISFKNFLKINQIYTKDLLLDRSDFNIKNNDLNFFINLMKIEPNRNKVIIKDSNIFFRNKNDEVLFINQINKSYFYYDFKNLKNVLNSKNKVFNIPFKLISQNDKLNKKFEFKFNSKKLVLKIENETNYSKKNINSDLKITFKNRNNLFRYKVKKNSLNFNLKDSNKTYDGIVEFKPFYFTSNLNYNVLKLNDFVNPFLIQIFKSQIFNNENLNAKINFNVKNIYDFDRFSNLMLKLRIEQGKMTFSNSQINWKDNVNLSLEDAMLDFENEKIYFNGKMLVNIKDKNDFYRSFQIKKNFRKDLKKIEFDFNYDFIENKVYFDNLRLDNKTNENLDKFISKFNTNDAKFFNKITFKSFVNKIFNAYFG